LQDASGKALARLLRLDDLEVEVEGAVDLFGAPFRVADTAVRSVGAAVAAVAAFDGERTGVRRTAGLDGRHAAAAFHSERFVRLVSQEAPALWDPIAGNYATADGWIRLHTNLAPHRDAALAVLGVEAERTAVAAAVARWSAGDLEAAVSEAGGVAARMRTRSQYLAHPQHQAVLTRPVVDTTTGARSAPPRPLGAGTALDGVRVLDLSRVIAGPVAGRFLASFGADVIRVDAPLDDGLLLEIDTGFGKRRTDLDLRAPDDRRRFEDLVADADVLLEGFRPGALAALGYPDAALRERSPALVIGHLSAYGDRGPWGDRRGFDSVVQVATGVAHACGFDPVTGPGKLPAQALDHASGYLMAAGLVSALCRQRREGTAATVHVSLARTAEWLVALGPTDRARRELPREEIADLLDRRHGTAWGTIEHLRPPGRIGSRTATWTAPPRPRSEAPATWATGP
jgi:crotonobetainyl-CoA:carnitine CoA-transferase CaiB-like acyl-CoA transferase